MMTHKALKPCNVLIVKLHDQELMSEGSVVYLLKILNNGKLGSDPCLKFEAEIKEPSSLREKDKIKLLTLIHKVLYTLHQVNKVTDEMAIEVIAHVSDELGFDSNVARNKLSWELVKAQLDKKIETHTKEIMDDLMIPVDKLLEELKKDKSDDK